MIPESVKGYVFAVSHRGREEVKMGIMDENQQKANVYITTRYDPGIEVSIRLINVWPLYRAKVRQYTRTKFEDYSARVAIGDGYVFVAKDDGSVYYDRCAVKVGLKSLYCIIYQGGVDVVFDDSVIQRSLVCQFTQ